MVFFFNPNASNPPCICFSLGYFNFLKDIRAKNPNALVACIEPLQHSCSGENPKLTGIVDGLAQAVNDMNDQKIKYYETGSPSNPWLVCSTDYSDWTHPTVKGNEKFASKLYDAMKNDVCSFFPGKCTGSIGPTSTPVTSLIPTPPSGFNYRADHGEDSRLIAVSFDKSGFCSL